MASGRTASSNAKLGCNVDPTLRPDSRLAFRLQMRQTHGTHGTQGIIFADDARSEDERSPDVPWEGTGIRVGESQIRGTQNAIAEDPTQ